VVYDSPVPWTCRILHKCLYAHAQNIIEVSIRFVLLGLPFFFCLKLKNKRPNGCVFIYLETGGIGMVF